MATREHVPSNIKVWLKQKNWLGGHYGHGDWAVVVGRTRWLRSLYQVLLVVSPFTWRILNLLYSWLSLLCIFGLFSRMPLKTSVYMNSFAFLARPFCGLCYSFSYIPRWRTGKPSRYLVWEGSKGKQEFSLATTQPLQRAVGRQGKPHEWRVTVFFLVLFRNAVPTLLLVFSEKLPFQRKKPP